LSKKLPLEKILGSSKRPSRVTHQEGRRVLLSAPVAIHHSESHRTQPATWAADQATWRAALERFVERGRKGGPFGPHPGFGSLSTKEWGRLVCLRNDHPLRQFGV
jgi:hypothetical protein